jgi:hypothetical protein
MCDLDVILLIQIPRSPDSVPGDVGKGWIKTYICATSRDKTRCKTDFFVATLKTLLKSRNLSRANFKLLNRNIIRKITQLFKQKGIKQD